MTNDTFAVAVLARLHKLEQENAELRLWAQKLEREHNASAKALYQITQHGFTPFHHRHYETRLEDVIAPEDMP